MQGAYGTQPSSVSASAKGSFESLFKSSKDPLKIVGQNPSNLAIRSSHSPMRFLPLRQDPPYHFLPAWNFREVATGFVECLNHVFREANSHRFSVCRWAAHFFHFPPLDFIAS